MRELKLYRCCNTCENKDNSFYGCKKAKECYNGFSAYSPNPEMKAHGIADLIRADIAEGK